MVNPVLGHLLDQGLDHSFQEGGETDVVLNSGRLVRMHAGSPATSDFSNRSPNDNGGDSRGEAPPLGSVSSRSSDLGFRRTSLSKEVLQRLEDEHVRDQQLIAEMAQVLGEDAAEGGVSRVQKKKEARRKRRAAKQGIRDATSNSHNSFPQAAEEENRGSGSAGSTVKRTGIVHADALGLPAQSAPSASDTKSLSDMLAEQELPTSANLRSKRKRAQRPASAKATEPEKPVDTELEKAEEAYRNRQKTLMGKVEVVKEWNRQSDNRDAIDQREQARRSNWEQNSAINSVSSGMPSAVNVGP